MERVKHKDSDPDRPTEEQATEDDLQEGLEESMDGSDAPAETRPGGQGHHHKDKPQD